MEFFFINITYLYLCMSMNDVSKNDVESCPVTWLLFRVESNRFVRTCLDVFGHDNNLQKRSRRRRVLSNWAYVCVVCRGVIVDC